MRMAFGCPLVAVTTQRVDGRQKYTKICEEGHNNKSQSIAGLATDDGRTSESDIAGIAYFEVIICSVFFLALFSVVRPNRSLFCKLLFGEN